VTTSSAAPSAAPTPAPARPQVPTSLRGLVLALAGLLVVLVALPIVMSLDREGTAASLLRDDPSLGSGELEVGVDVVLAYTWTLHVVYGAAAAWLVAKTLRGRRWARIALTVLMVGATINSLDSAASGPEYYWAVILGDVIHVVVVVLLWLPRSAREFFAAHRVRKDAVGRRGRASAP